MVILSLSRASSSSSILEDFLPHLQSEDEDWKQFAYLLDSFPLEKEEEKKKKDNEDMEWRLEELYGYEKNEEKSEEEEPREESRLEEVKKRLGGMGREECGGVQISRRIQWRIIEDKKKRDEEKKIKEEEEKRRRRKRKLSRRHSPLSSLSHHHHSSSHRTLDPSEISLGSPSQLMPSSPKKRRDSERTHPSSRKEDRWDTIADRVRRGKRTSESEESSIRRERRVTVELPETHMPSPSSQEIDDRCFCGKSYNPKKAYLQCRLCTRHNHIRCLQLSEKKARKLAPSFVCDRCQMKEEDNEETEELFCLCQTPYDDTKFYVGCDSCEGWYHPMCVSITQEDAETVAEYICPVCSETKKEEEREEREERDGGGGSSRREEIHRQSRHQRTNSMSTTFSGSLHIPRSVNLSRSDFPILRSLIDSIYREKMAAPFRFPVDINEYPEYLNVINQPMDLTEMMRKVEQLEYHRIDDLAQDFMTMLTNARKFNAEGSPIHKHSFVLEAIFDSRLLEAKRAMITKREKMRKQSECGTVDSCLDIDTDQLIDAGVDPSMFESIL